MTGISEILVLVLLIACILILPRLLKGVPAQSSDASAVNMRKLSAKARFGIVLSVVYPVSAALFIRPWDGPIVTFLSFGIFPVLLGWGIVWILSAKK